MMSKLLTYLILPEEVSPTERAHVERINRIALLGFWLHLPVFMAVAWACDTGPWVAFGLTVATLIGPSLAYARLESHRAVAMVFGFTAMLLGGLLVHFGQGPMQIEMHFYFFVLLALLATYANPLVNLVAAATAAVHHLVVWLVLPSSVFNYDASFGVVAVHALFVVLETVAAVFIARSFYDNVIGLERIVAARTHELEVRGQEMRLVLDNVAQGLLTIGFDGRMSGGRSAVLDRWLGTPPPSEKLSDWLRPFSTATATWLELGLEELAADLLPAEVVLAQLPKSIRLEGDGEPARIVSLEYALIPGRASGTDRVLVVMSDMTEAVARAEREARQRENLMLFELLANDASGFEEFFNEASRIVARVTRGAALDAQEAKRLVHTLKGNAALFDLENVARTCHEVEDAMEASGEALTPEQAERVVDAWRAVEERVAHLTGGDKRALVTVPKTEIEEVLEALRAGAPREEVERRMHRLPLEPAAKRVSILADQARKIAARLGRSNVRVEQDIGHDVRFEPGPWASFWSSLVHVLRNAVDHGLERPEEREGAGKPEDGRLTLRARVADGAFVFEIEDDGRGIDFHRVAEKARSMGLPHEETQELVEALFADGLSTKSTVTETSGRGVGMSAVRTEARALGGEVVVASEPGRGTRIAFEFPRERTKGIAA